MTKTMVWLVFLAGLGLVGAALWATLRGYKSGSGKIRLPTGAEVSWKGAAATFLVFAAAFMYGGVTWSMKIDDRERAEISESAKRAENTINSIKSGDAAELAPKPVEAARAAHEDLTRNLKEMDRSFTLFRSYRALQPKASDADDASQAAARAVSSARTEISNTVERAHAELREVNAAVEKLPHGSVPQQEMIAIRNQIVAQEQTLTHADNSLRTGNLKMANAYARTVISQLDGLKSKIAR